ncbi:Pr6Pr family membrane protein [Mucilaginibacter ximonensis]|uniref:Pr6Pr family membrane protein n=1 Tax=Mucilaginibacter ximonensis TaxID=538021 RepID=A0ABW5Y6V3_9SPHI
MKQRTKNIYMVALAILIWLALCIQFYISTIKYMNEGRTFGGAIVQLLTFFTIQNNLLIALALTLLLVAPKSNWGRFFSRPSVLGALSLYIIIVCIVYQVILRKEHTQYGLFRFCDEVFHSVSPPAFLIFWLVFITKGNLPWSKAFTWLIYPLIYFVYVIGRGLLTGYYPYSFLDHNKLTFERIGINFVFLLITFLIIGFALIGISRLAKKR